MDATVTKIEVRVNTILTGILVVAVMGVLWQLMQIQNNLGGLTEVVRAQGSKSAP